MTALRPYQQHAVNEVRQRFREGARSVLVVAPCGAGKGTIAAHLLASATRRGRRAAVIAPRLELVRDLAGRVTGASGEPVSIYAGADTEVVPGALVSVGTVQTLAARDVPLDLDLLIADEAHHATCASYRAVRAASPRAVLVGLTATPQRGDGAPLGDVFERLVVAATTRELTDAGHLVPVEVYAPQRPRDTPGTVLAMEPADAYARWGEGRRAIVFCASQAHAQAVAATIPGAASVESDLPDDERRRRLEAFACGDLRVLTNCMILTEGYNDPSVEFVILARGASHAGSYLQMVGRGLRPSPGKARCIFLDLVGACFNHGHPAAERDYSLEGTPIRAVVPPDFEIRTCTQCGRAAELHAFQDSTCPYCGERSKGRADPRVVRAEMERAHEEKMRRISSQKHVEALRQLVEDAKAKGHKPGAAFFGFQRKFHRFPTKAERAAAKGASQ